MWVSLLKLSSNDHQLFLNKGKPHAVLTPKLYMSPIHPMRVAGKMEQANREETLMCLVICFSPVCQTWYFNLDPSRVRTSGYCSSEAAVLSLTLPDNAASLQFTFRKVESTFLIKLPVSLYLQNICIYFSHCSFNPRPPLCSPNLEI